MSSVSLFCLAVPCSDFSGISLYPPASTQLPVPGDLPRLRHRVLWRRPAHSSFRKEKTKARRNWPHPAVTIPALKDARIVHDAHQEAATLLGYNVHKEPWRWPDAVRIKHGVIVGGTGAGKSTFLENIIAQDLTRRFGARKMPMIIFDGKGEREFLDHLLPHIAAAGACRICGFSTRLTPRNPAATTPSTRLMTPIRST